jgi:hypothetical protein
VKSYKGPSALTTHKKEKEKKNSDYRSNKLEFKNPKAMQRN